MTWCASAITDSPDTTVLGSAPPFNALRFGATRPPVPGRCIATSSMTSPSATINDETEQATTPPGCVPSPVSDDVATIGTSRSAQDPVPLSTLNRT